MEFFICIHDRCGAVVIKAIMNILVDRDKFYNNFENHRN